MTDRRSSTPADRNRASVIIWAIAGAGLLLRLAPLLIPGGFLSYRVNYDEGVYFSAAALLAGGVVPYRDFVLVHPPGLSLLLAPVAGLALIFDPAVVFGAARVLVAGIGVINTVLAGRVALHHFGPLAGVAAALLYATHPETIREERGPMLEPVLNLACLVFATLWLRSAVTRRPVHDSVMAGIVGGLAVAIKLWAAFWLIAVLAALEGEDRTRRLAALSAGAATALVATAMPFLLADAGAVLEQVLLFQMGRPSQGVGSPLLRLAHMVVVTAPAALAVSMVLARWRTAGAAARLFTVTYLLVALSFLASPVYFPRYTSHLAAPAAVLGGFAVSTLSEQWRDRGRLARTPVAVVGLYALFQVAFAAWNTYYYRLPEQRELARAIRSEVPPTACLFSVEPGWAILGGRLPEQREGIPLVIDAHATRLLHRRRSGAASDTPSPVGRAVDGCPYLVVGNWGLSPAQRSALEREWARLHPRHTPAGPELWVRVER